MDHLFLLHRWICKLVCVFLAGLAFSVFTFLAFPSPNALVFHVDRLLHSFLFSNPAPADLPARGQLAHSLPAELSDSTDLLAIAKLADKIDSSSVAPSPAQASGPSTLPAGSSSPSPQPSSSSQYQDRPQSLPSLKSNDISSCDISVGEWVLDGLHYPLYQARHCPFVDEAFGCQENGRPDSDYLKWRWKPEGCDLPRFAAQDFLEKLRGKRMVFAGDSLMRNQWESMLCLLREGLADKSRMMEAKQQRITKGKGDFVFKFLDYNATVEFHRSHFLVAEGRQARGPTRKPRLTLRIDTIHKTSKYWRNTDILVFTTGHWWNHGKTARGLLSGA